MEEQEEPSTQEDYILQHLPDNVLETSSHESLLLIQDANSAITASVSNQGGETTAPARKDVRAPAAHNTMPLDEFELIYFSKRCALHHGLHRKALRLISTVVHL